MAGGISATGRLEPNLAHVVCTSNNITIKQWFLTSHSITTALCIRGIFGHTNMSCSKHVLSPASHIPSLLSHPLHTVSYGNSASQTMQSRNYTHSFAMA